VVFVENASRLARSVVVQEAGLLILQAARRACFGSNGDDLTQTEDEMKVAMSQSAGVFAQLQDPACKKNSRWPLLENRDWYEGRGTERLSG
jgi:hypothetical protein